MSAPTHDSMETIAGDTRFAGIGSRAAWSVFAGMLVVALWSIASSWDLPGWASGGMAIPDLEFYRAVVERVRAGESYHAAAGAEFRAMGFAAPSVFNWRPPTYAWLLAALPDPFAYYLLITLAAGSVIAAALTLLPPRCGMATMALGVILLLGGTFSWCFWEPELFLSTEPWCEALLLLSLCAYARGVWPLGMGLALAALSLRELVLPFCVVAGAMSVWERRWLETALWLVALGGFAGLFAWHMREVTQHAPAEVSAAATQWLTPHGLRFVLASGVMNVFLRPIPPVLLAWYLPLAFVGLAGWKGETGLRVALSTASYVVPFLFVWGGDYWGLLYTPMLILGLIHAPAALRDLWRAARRK